MSRLDNDLAVQAGQGFRQADEGLKLPYSDAVRCTAAGYSVLSAQPLIRGNQPRPRLQSHVAGQILMLTSGNGTSWWH